MAILHWHIALQCTAQMGKVCWFCFPYVDESRLRHLSSMYKVVLFQDKFTSQHSKVLTELAALVAVTTSEHINQSFDWADVFSQKCAENWSTTLQTYCPSPIATKSWKLVVGQKGLGQYPDVIQKSKKRLYIVVCTPSTCQLELTIPNELRIEEENIFKVENRETSKQARLSLKWVPGTMSWEI